MARTDFRLVKQVKDCTWDECVKQIEYHVGLLAHSPNAQRFYHEEMVKEYLARMDQIVTGIANVVMETFGLDYIEMDEEATG